MRLESPTGCVRDGWYLKWKNVANLHLVLVKTRGIGAKGVTGKSPHSFVGLMIKNPIYK
jgi:hypothetical protein